MIPTLRQLITDGYQYLGLNFQWANSYAQISLFVFVLLASLLLAYLCQRFLIPPILRLVKHTSIEWDDYLINQPVMRALCQLIPSLLVYNLLPLCFDNHTDLLYTLLYRGTRAYIAFSSMMLVAAFLKNVTTIASQHFDAHHLVGALQFTRLMTFCLGSIVILSLLLGNNPVRVIAGLGAAATVLMLVFKDSILGLVAGIQLSMNKMLKVGDWVTIKKLDVNGTVEELSLTTIKVRNFDNTISTIPPYTLVSDSFQNWQGMYAKGLRRVKRSLYIDIRSVHFANNDEKELLRRKKLISKTDFETANITNLTLFRHYISQQLKNDPQVSNDPWVLARQLDPTPNGLPLEIWFYTPVTSFIPFEEIASERMEQFIAMLNTFGLEHYQAPAGNDLLNLRQSTR